jgi:hypothetical protein
MVHSNPSSRYVPWGVSGVHKGIGVIAPVHGTVKRMSFVDPNEVIRAT